MKICPGSTMYRRRRNEQIGVILLSVTKLSFTIKKELVMNIENLTNCAKYGEM